jgi:hypothetical protein
MTLLAALLAAVTLFQYWPSLSFGFNYDDYHFVRPYTADEVGKSFHANWDESGIERRFYRPMTVALFAARFALFRYDEFAYHLASVLALTVCGAVVMLFAWRVSNTLVLPLWFAVVWAMHPNLPLSMGAWITNQMHLFQALVFVSALSWWYYVRRKPAGWWSPLLALGLLAFLIKEDGVLLLPVIIVTHELYRRLVDRQVPAIPKPVLLAVPLLIAVLVGWRYYVLGGWGGARTPPQDLETIWANLAKGPTQVLFLRPALQPVTKIQAWTAAVILPLGALAAFLRSRSIAFLWCFGIIIVVLFDLPFALLTKREQFYLISIGAVTTLSASLAALTLVARSWFKPIIVAAGLVLVSAMHVSSRDAIDLFAPRNPATLATDAIVEEWAAVPPEIRAWIKAKREGRAVTKLSADLPTIVYGAYSPERDRAGREFRWTSDRVRVFCHPRVSTLKFVLRPLLIERPRRPFTVTVLLEGRTVETLLLDDERERGLSVAIPAPASPASLAFAASRMREVEIIVDHTWSPGPQDTRQLGIMLFDLTPEDANGGVVPTPFKLSAGAD